MASGEWNWTAIANQLNTTVTVANALYEAIVSTFRFYIKQNATNPHLTGSPVEQVAFMEKMLRTTSHFFQTGFSSWLTAHFETAVHFQRFLDWCNRIDWVSAGTVAVGMMATITGQYGAARRELAGYSIHHLLMNQAYKDQRGNLAGAFWLVGVDVVTGDHEDHFDKSGAAGTAINNLYLPQNVIPDAPPWVIDPLHNWSLEFDISVNSDVTQLNITGFQTDATLVQSLRRTGTGLELGRLWDGFSSYRSQIDFGVQSFVSQSVVTESGGNTYLTAENSSVELFLGRQTYSIRLWKDHPSNFVRVQYWTQQHGTGLERLLAEEWYDGSTMPAMNITRWYFWSGTSRIYSIQLI